MRYGSNFCTCTLQAARLQQAPERGGGDALAERRDDAARDEDVLRRRVTRGRPSRSSARRPGVRSISAPSERRSPRRVSPASAPIASQRPRPVSRLTELKPSSAPSAFDPASPSIAHLAKIVGKQQDGDSRAGAPTSGGRDEVRLQRAARPRVELVQRVRGEADEQRAGERARRERARRAGSRRASAPRSSRRRAGARGSRAPGPPRGRRRGRSRRRPRRRGSRRDADASSRRAAAAGPRWLTPSGPAGEQRRRASWRAAVHEAARVAAGRAVRERQLDLRDAQPGADGVDRHPHLAAEAGREREARLARRADR